MRSQISNWFAEFAGFVQATNNNETAVIENFTSTDAFGKARVSSPFTLFDDSHLYAKNDGTNGIHNWTYDLTGSGTATYNGDKNAVILTATTASGDKVIKETHRYITYIPGKGVLMKITGVMGTGETNCEKRIGQFNDENGVFFYEIDGTYGVAVRNKASGSVVNTEIDQADWNFDPMDGTGVSGLKVDFSKFQIFMIYYSWLGGGTAVFALMIQGKIWPVHIYNNANFNNTVFVHTPTLPIRYEIENTAATTGSNTIESICTSIFSEGAEAEPSGAIWERGNGATLIGSITTRRPICAIRLLNSFESKANRVIVKFLEASFFAVDQNVYFEVVHYDDPTSITGTWSDVNTNVSACEVSVDISAISGGTEHKMQSLYVPASSQGQRIASGSSVRNIAGRNPYNFLAQNFDSTASEVIVVFATSINGSAAQAAANIAWQEIH